MIKKLLAKRRARRRKLKGTRADKRAARRRVTTLREDVRHAEGDAKQELVAELLQARHELDQLEGQARARRARVARATKKLTGARAARQAPSGLITRAQWGAAPPRGSYVPQGTPFARVQHHTADVTMSDTASVAEEAARMRQVQAQHMSQGWTDMGYCRVVFPSGRGL